MQIEDYLYQKNHHEPLSKVKLDTMTMEQRNSRINSSMIDPVDTVHKHGVQHYQGDYNIIFVESNVKMREKSLAMNKVCLMRRLFNLQMFEDGSSANHINEFNMIVSQLIAVKTNFENEIKALILIFLPESWDTFVFEINHFQDLRI